MNAEITGDPQNQRDIKKFSKKIFFPGRLLDDNRLRVCLEMFLKNKNPQGVMIFNAS